MEGTRHGGLIAAQMLDVAIRVQAIRHFAVSQMVGALRLGFYSHVLSSFVSCSLCCLHLSLVFVRDSPLFFKSAFV